MKYILAGLLAFSWLFVVAQPAGAGAPQHTNSFLNQSFWQNNPDVTAIKAEIARGNSPSELNSNAFDPVVMAINAGAPDESIIYLLEQKGNDVNKITHDSRTYIFWAASKGNTAIMKWLLSKGAKTNLQDSHGTSPLTFAAGGGQKNIAVYDLLVANGVNLKTDVNHDGANALLLAIGGDNDFKLTEYFQSKGLDLKATDAEGNTAFNYAARAGNIDVMKKLISKGVKYTNNAMVMAAMGTRRGANGIEVFQYLESLGIQPSATSKSGANALHYLARRPGQTALVKYFLDKKTDVNQKDEDGNTVLINAAAAADVATLELITPLTKLINTKNEAGVTALAAAVRGNSAEVVEYLIDKGANVNTTDAKGNNLAYYLVESYNPRQAANFEPKAQLLKAKGFNIATPQKDGNTIYHLAVAKGDLALLKQLNELVGTTADVNQKNKDGFTALHKAAMTSKNDGILKYLVSIGATKNIKTEFDETAFDLAGENEFLTKEKVAIDFLK